MAVPLKIVGNERGTGRRGVLDRPLTPHARSTLTAIMRELGAIQDKAPLIGDDFLAYRIGAAAGEARDRLRDDLIIREEWERGDGEFPVP